MQKINFNFNFQVKIGFQKMFLFLNAKQMICEWIEFFIFLVVQMKTHHKNYSEGIMFYKNYFKIAFLLFVSSTLFAQSEQKAIAVTVYNNNLGVVKDIREMNIKSGISTIKITDVAQLIDPTSVHIKIDGNVLEQNYQYDLVSLSKILQKYVDKSITLIDEKGNVAEGKLLSSFGNQIVLKKKDGTLLMLPNVDKYRISVDKLPGGLITRPTLVWKLDSNKGGKQNVEVSYQTAGMNWHAEYVALLNKADSKVDLNSWVSLKNNSGTTFNNATLKLVAGDVHRVKPRQSNRQNVLYDMVMPTQQKSQFAEKSFFEYHIYNLQNTTTLANNETKQISLFEANDVSVQKKYLYTAGQYYNDTQNKVSVIIEFNNSKKNNLGLPMPKGKVRVYKSDGESVEFIGEDRIDHTPRNEKLKLKIGDAFDILAKENMIDNKKISNKVYQQTFSITLTNRKKTDITVDVERYLGLNWEILKTTNKYQKENAQKVLFKIPVKSNSKFTLRFTVQYVR